jgi:hypothetical protein
MIFKDDYLEVQAFDLEYVHEHLIPTDWETHYELDVDYDLVPLHTPLYKYAIPVKFDESKETKVMRYVKGGV